MHRKTEDRLKIFSTASLIKRFNERCPLDEIYNKGIKCYDVLLDLIENPKVAKEISEFIKIPSEKIKIAAIGIVNLLLFNKMNNPFLSLGLSNHATDNETRKRWKRLLMIYHPDRLFSQKTYEEMAKKINQAYREIEELEVKNFHYEKVTENHIGKVIKKREKYFSVKTNTNKYFISIFNHRYLKYLPAFILVIVISMAIFTIALFIIIHKIEINNSDITQPKTENKIPANMGAQFRF